MVPEQKRAWFVVVFFGMCSAMFVGLLLHTYLSVVRAAIFSFCWFGPFLLILPLLVHKKERASDEIVEDERDRMIEDKATMAGGVACYMSVVLVCLVPLFIYLYQGKEFIKVDVLGDIVVCMVVANFFVKAIVTLILYGRAGSDGGD